VALIAAGRLESRRPPEPNEDAAYQFGLTTLWRDTEVRLPPA
jgi:hypothetical protein